MRPLAALTILLLAAPGVAGCIGSEVEPEPIGANGTLQDPAGALAPLVPLDVALASSAVWTRPGETVSLTATSATATRFEWFLAPVASGHGGGHDHGGGGHEAAPSGRAAPAPANTGDIQPGVYSDPLTLAAEGLYGFHCHPHPWMMLTVVVAADADKGGMQHVQIVDGATQDAYRFVPDTLRVRPGTQLVFWNNGTAMHTATQDAFAWRIPQTGSAIEYVPEDVGDFDVLVVATDDARGRGEARTRLLVDAAKPDALQAVGPFAGEFQKGVPNDPEPEREEFAFSSAHAIETLDISFAATSDAPAPAMISLSLLRDGQEIASATAAESGSLGATNLPAGAYVLRATAAQGVLISYEIAGEALLALVPPERAEGAAGGHHH